MNFSSNLFLFLFSILSLSSPLLASDSNDCRNYLEISSKDRQLLSDARYAFSSIPTNLSDEEFKKRFHKVLKEQEDKFLIKRMRDYFHGLAVEGMFRRWIDTSIGIDNIDFKRFEIFADLILYHKANGHKGFVDPEQFKKAKLQLLDTINSYFNEKERPLASKIAENKKSLIQALRKKNYNSAPWISSLTQSFVKLESHRKEMIGALELFWNQLLVRNQNNLNARREDLAIQRVSTDIAIAVLGFGTTIGYGSSIMTAGRRIWSLPVSAAIGCTYGVANTFYMDKMSSSYIDLSRALYSSLSNGTSYACELGERIENKSNQKSLEKINFDTQSLSSSDYILGCVGDAAFMVAPGPTSIVLAGMSVTAFATSSYELFNQTLVLIKELPNLYKLKKQMSGNLMTSNTDEIMKLNRKIKDAEALSVLYLLALGNASQQAIGSGSLLHSGGLEVKDMVKSGRSFLKSNPKGDDSSMSLLDILIGILEYK